MLVTTGGWGTCCAMILLFTVVFIFTLNLLFGFEIEGVEDAGDVNGLRGV